MDLTYRLSNEANQPSIYPDKSEISTLFDKYKKEKRFVDNLSERTMHCYTQVFDRWEKYVGGMPTKENLKDFIIKMREAGLSPVTVNLSIRCFNSFLTWLKKNDHIKKKLRLQKIKEEKPVLKTFSDEQLKALLHWRPRQDKRNECRIYAILCTLTDCGLRITECLEIELANVDFNNLLITVMGKGSKERIVPMSIELRKILYRYVQKHRFTQFDSKYLFCTSTGTTLTYRNAYRDLAAVMLSVGVDKNDIDGFFHAFRRKFARSYVKTGGNLFYLQAAMGHATLQMTKHYVEVDSEDLAAAHVKTSLLSRLR